MSQPMMVITTSDEREILTGIANVLVEKRLAACCQIGGPLTSIYRWQGKIENSEEWVCQIKTVSARLEAVISEIRQLHNYDEPEIVAMEISGGSQGYLDWIAEQSDGK